MMRTCIAAALMVQMTASLGATVLIPADLGELSREARAVVRGRVIALDARWTENRRGIETVVTLAVDASLKGSTGTDVQFRVPGGTLGRYRNVFIGAPEFSLGDQVIVFLGARGPMVPYLLGLGQGVFRLTPRTGGGWTVRSMTLGEFERQVRAFAGARP